MKGLNGTRHATIKCYVCRSISVIILLMSPYPMNRSRGGGGSGAPLAAYNMAGLGGCLRYEACMGPIATSKYSSVSDWPTGEYSTGCWHQFLNGALWQTASHWESPGDAFPACCCIDELEK